MKRTHFIGASASALEPSRFALAAKKNPPNGGFRFLPLLVSEQQVQKYRLDNFAESIFAARAAPYKEIAENRRFILDTAAQISGPMPTVCPKHEQPGASPAASLTL
jgi:hypothetical protein